MAKKLVIAFATLVVVVVMVSIVLTMRVRSASRSWREYLSSLRAAGEPLTFADIQARRSPVPADSRTVADVVARVVDEVKTSPGPISRGVLGMSDGPSIDFFGGIPVRAVETTRQYVATRRPALVDLETIYDLELGDFKISYNGPPTAVATRFIETSPTIQTLTQLLYLDATLKLIDGDTEGAAGLIPKLFDVVSPLAEEPASMAHLRRISTAALAVRILENTLRVGSLGDEMLKELDETLTKYLDSHSIKWALWGERALFITMFDQTRSAVHVPGATLFVATYDDQRHGAEMLQWLIDANDDPAKLLTARKRIESELPGLPKSHMFTGMNLTSISMLVTLHLRCLAEVRCARIATAAERFRLAEGELPGTLEQLVPAYLPSVPVDPFDQTPMKLARRDTGMIIYSVGEDATDGGGQVVPNKGEKRPRDCGFRLLSANHRGLVLNQTPAEDDG